MSYTLPGLTRIAMSPWSYQASDVDEIAALNARAEALDALVSTVKRSDRKWMARGFRKGYVGVVEFVGNTLTGAIAGALDAFEEQQRERYTPDELVVIHAQSQWPVDHGEGE